MGVEFLPQDFIRLDARMANTLRLSLPFCLPAAINGYDLTSVQEIYADLAL